jgi:tRNA (guanine-N(7)-)-methyltransferase
MPAPASRNTKTDNEDRLFGPEHLKRLLLSLEQAGQRRRHDKISTAFQSNRQRTEQGKRLEVEIGCGNGHFLVEFCTRNPDVLFFGVEIKKKRCLKAVKKINRRGLENAFVIHGTGEEVIRLLPDGCVDAFHLYFPDPWPKSRHRRRRFLRLDNLTELLRSLKDNGLILVVTDFFDYYLHTKLLFILQPDLTLTQARPSESVLVSVYGQRFLDLGKPLRTLAARKIASGRD